MPGRAPRGLSRCSRARRRDRRCPDMPMQPSAMGNTEGPDPRRRALACDCVVTAESYDSPQARLGGVPCPTSLRLNGYQKLFKELVAGSQTAGRARGVFVPRPMGAELRPPHRHLISAVESKMRCLLSTVSRSLAAVQAGWLRRPTSTPPRQSRTSDRSDASRRSAAATARCVSAVERTSTPDSKHLRKVSNPRAPGAPARGSSSMPATRPMFRRSMTFGKPRSEWTASAQYDSSDAARSNNPSLR